MTITIHVNGIPAPKGSNRAIMRGGFAQLVPGGSDTGRKRMKSWARAVREAALDACSTTLKGRPVDVWIVFWMPRPNGHRTKAGKIRASAPMYPAVKPDIDKLARNTLDALAGVAYDDDSRIVNLVLRKIYAQPGQEGACITVAEAR